MPELTPLDPGGLVAGGAVWSQVTIAADFVFVSGQVAWDAEGRVVGEGSVERQTEQVFDNLLRALNAAGSSSERLVRITAYLVNAGDLDAFRTVRDLRLAGARPASTVVIVAGLVDSRLLVEVDAIALRSR